MKEIAECYAPAKLNWTLTVLRRRYDGYHEIDTLMQKVSLEDRLRISEAELGSVQMSGPFSEGVPTDATNLVCRAAEQYGQEAKLPVAFRIELEKNIPNGAGLGGGSSDAAAVLKALEEHYQALGEEKLHQIASHLGADIPFFLQANAARCRGIGTSCHAVAAQRHWLVLVMQGEAASTGAVYGRWYERRARAGRQEAMQLAADKTERAQELLATNDAATLGENLFNDLQRPACSLRPEIGQTIEKIQATNPFAAVMTGSGAACFGLYATQDEALEAAEKIEAKFVSVVSTLVSEKES